MGDTNLSSDASAGDLCMLIFIDLAHLFMRRGHCLPTHHSATLAVLLLVCRRRRRRRRTRRRRRRKKKVLRPGSWRQTAPKNPTRPFVSAPAHTCHLPPGLVIIVPVHWHGGGGRCWWWGFMFGWMNPLCEAGGQQTQPPQTACRSTEVQGL